MLKTCSGGQYRGSFHGSYLAHGMNISFFHRELDHNSSLAYFITLYREHIHKSFKKTTLVRHENVYCSTSNCKEAIPTVDLHC